MPNTPNVVLTVFQFERIIVTPTMFTVELEWIVTPSLFLLLAPNALVNSRFQHCIGNKCARPDLCFWLRKCRHQIELLWRFGHTVLPLQTKINLQLRLWWESPHHLKVKNPRHVQLWAGTNDGTKHFLELSDTVPGILQSKHLCHFANFNVLSSCVLGGSSVVCGFLAARAQALCRKHLTFWLIDVTLFHRTWHLLPAQQSFSPEHLLHAIWSALGYAAPPHRFLLLMRPICLRQLEMQQHYI